MSDLLKEFVAEEPLENCNRSFYHVSGMHVCELNSSFIVLSHNDFRDLKEKSKSIEDFDIITFTSLESAVEEVMNILEYANSRGAVDARFIQKRRGSDYKVNSQSQDSGVKPEAAIGRFKIDTIVDISLLDTKPFSDNKRVNSYFRKASLLGLSFFRKVKVKLKNKIPVTVIISAKVKKFTKVFGKAFKKSIEPSLNLSDKIHVVNVTSLVKYKKKGYINYYVADVKGQDLKKTTISAIELVNDSVATNELIASIGNYNIVKLTQHLFVPIKHGLPIGERELEDGLHLINNEIPAFDTERKAIEYIYSKVKGDKLHVEDKRIRLIDTIKVDKDWNIHYDVYYFNGKYLAVPSVYTIDIEEMSLLECEELMTTYKFCAYSDNHDFIKEALLQRGDWMDEWPQGNGVLSIYQDDLCILAKDIITGMVFDLTKGSASDGLTKEQVTLICDLIFSDSIGSSKKVESDLTLITRIGEMTIIEFEGYYFAVSNEFADDFPNNLYLDSALTRYDVSLSVIEEYCKELLMGDL